MKDKIIHKLTNAKIELSVDVFFFFQAEDGIRDIGVTGVQTCALPIFGREVPGGDVDVRRALDLGLVVGDAQLAALDGGLGQRHEGLLGAEQAGADGRSEERRVGKECRSRWSPYH